MSFRNEEQAEAEVSRRWNKLPPEEHTEHHMFNFWTELWQEHPDIFQWDEMGDPWQTVHCWLLEEEARKRGEEL